MYLNARTAVLPFFVIIALFLPVTAHADKVDRLIKQLTSDKSYKVRLSAALALTNLEDPRAIPAFITALEDSDETVSGVAAKALAKLITAETEMDLRKSAITKLKRLYKKSAEGSLPYKEAEAAIATLEGLGEGGTTAPTGGIYVNVGDMSAKAGNADAMRELMRKTVEKTFKKKAQGMTVDLGKSKTEGFHVDGTLAELKSETKGSQVLVSCKISMLIATYPKKSMFGFLNGGAKVQASNSPKDIEYAEKDCVTAVVEDLVTKQIIPTIEKRR